MDAAEREVWSVRNRQCRQNAAFCPESSALGNRDLTQRVRGPPYAAESARGDFDAGFIGFYRIRLISIFERKIRCAFYYFGRLFTVPLGKMFGYPD